MPRTIRRCLNYEVFAVEEGIRLGRPQDMLIDPKKHVVAAVVLVHKAIPQTATVIAGKDVGSYAEDTIPIPGLSAVHLAYQVRGATELVEDGLHFKGRDLISSEGHSVGRIMDALLDDDGKVIEYRAAKGLLRRLLRMTKPVKPSQLLTAGEDAAVVEAGASEKGEDT